MSTNFKQMKKSVKKALIDKEIPLKDKHARAIIIGTYHDQGSAKFWEIAFKQPILEIRISAWKFCHLLHKILREGHNLCCQESLQSIKYLTDLGKLWGHLTDGYGICILQYTKLLILKIEFHIRNPRFPATLKMSGTEIEKIGGGDIDSIFQLIIEIFDYLDALIGLQATVFNSLHNYHVNSMTLAGQCRVAALIPCIEDANSLYDLSISFMFKLHEHLTHDILDGHRRRFNAIFVQLRIFYEQSTNLQYFVNLVTVPKLPGQLPNFSINCEINEYQSSTVVVPEENVIETVRKEVTTTEIYATTEQKEPKSQPSDYFEQLVGDSSTMRSTSQIKRQQYEQNFIKLNDDLIVLKNENHCKDDMLKTIQREKQLLEQKIQNYDSAKSERLVNERDGLIQQLHTELFTVQKEKQFLEEKIQKHDKEISEVEEKFAKLLPLYMETRTDHINLLRQNQEINKAMRELRKSFEQLENDKVKVEKELIEMQRMYEGTEKLNSNWDLRKIQ